MGRHQTREKYLCGQVSDKKFIPDDANNPNDQHTQKNKTVY